MSDEPRQRLTTESQQTTAQEGADALRSARAAIAADIERRQEKAKYYSNLLEHQQAQEQENIQANTHALLEQTVNALLLDRAQQDSSLSLEVADKIFNHQQKKERMRLEEAAQQEKFKVQNLQIRVSNYRWQCEMLVAIFLFVTGIILYIPFLGTSSHPELGTALIGAGTAVLTGKSFKSPFGKKEKDDANTSGGK